VKCHVSASLPRVSQVGGGSNIVTLGSASSLLSLLPKFGAPDDRYLGRHVAKFHSPTSQDGRSSAEAGPLDLCSRSRCLGRIGYRSPGQYVIKLDTFGYVPSTWGHDGI
jgi:hypothetical protein